MASMNHHSLPHWPGLSTDIFWFHRYLVVLCSDLRFSQGISDALAQVKSGESAVVPVILFSLSDVVFAEKAQCLVRCSETLPILSDNATIESTAGWRVLTQALTSSARKKPTIQTTVPSASFDSQEAPKPFPDSSIDQSSLIMSSCKRKADHEMYDPRDVKRLKILWFLVVKGSRSSNGDLGMCALTDGRQGSDSLAKSLPAWEDIYYSSMGPFNFLGATDNRRIMPCHASLSKEAPDLAEETILCNLCYLWHRKSCNKLRADGELMGPFCIHCRLVDTSAFNPGSLVRQSRVSSDRKSTIFRRGYVLTKAFGGSMVRHKRQFQLDVQGARRMPSAGDTRSVPVRDDVGQVIYSIAFGGSYSGLSYVLKHCEVTSSSRFS